MRRPAPKSSLSGHPLSDRWPDRKSPFCAACLLMDTDDRPIDEDVFEIRISRRGFENAIENTCLCPAGKPPEDTVPGPKARWQIPPGCASTHLLQDRFEKQPVVTRRYTAIAFLARQKRSDDFPLSIRQHKAFRAHADLPKREFEHGSAQMGTHNCPRALGRVVS